MKNIDRRKFLKITGSVAIGGLFLSVVGNGLWKMFTRPDKLFYGDRKDKGFDFRDYIPFTKDPNYKK